MSTSRHDVDLSDCPQAGDWLVDMMNEPTPQLCAADEVIENDPQLRLGALARAGGMIRHRIVGRVLVVLYDGELAGLDTAGGTERYSLVCERHGHLITDSDKRRLWRHAQVPSDWCEACRDEQDGTDLPIRPPAGFHEQADRTLVCPHRDLSVCGACAASSPAIMEGMGAHYWVPNAGDRTELRAVIS